MHGRVRKKLCHRCRSIFTGTCKEGVDFPEACHGTVFGFVLQPLPILTYANKHEAPVALGGSAGQLNDKLAGLVDISLMLQV